MHSSHPRTSAQTLHPTFANVYSSYALSLGYTKWAIPGDESVQYRRFQPDPTKVSRDICSVGDVARTKKRSIDAMEEAGDAKRQKFIITPAVEPEASENQKVGLLHHLSQTDRQYTRGQG
jgi:hypothetical protein